LLYNVPPLYHLNLAEWKKRKDFIRREYAFFSPLHRRGALLPMTKFTWLTDDRLVQQTQFADELEITANFSDKPFAIDGVTVPPKGVLAKNLLTNESTTWQSG
jgi:hypothetical protein